MGALKLCKDYVAWCPVDEALLSSLLESQGQGQHRRSGSTRRRSRRSATRTTLSSHRRCSSRAGALSSVSGLKPFFGLSPPRGGFKRSSRRQFREGGVLGENPKLPDIVRRMI